MDALKLGPSTFPPKGHESLALLRHAAKTAFLNYRSPDPTVTTGADTIDVTPAATAETPDE